MFKRTKGYFLLTMLVLTGLAGRIHSNILTTKERRTLATELKTSKNDFFKTVEELSSTQMNFRANKKQKSIKEYTYEVISLENYLWVLAQSSLKQETSSTARSFSDENLTSYVDANNTFQHTNLKFRTVKDALKFYKTERSEMLKYVHTSTENVRGHIAQTEKGNFDVYQLMMLNTLYCKYYIGQIELLKSHPNFPK